ncbi:hypothetical protein SAMN05444673_0503 [Bacillus sp. OV166]|nr:hypothetical protein SAMN05444673_0503 [Bacillus sp. OV166]
MFGSAFIFIIEESGYRENYLKILLTLSKLGGSILKQSLLTS